MMKLIQLPVPLLAAAVAPQLPDAAPPTWPWYIIAGGTAIWVFVQVADKFGLIGAGQDRRDNSFTPDDRELLKGLRGDREVLKEIHRTISREDPDKPGWPMVWSAAKESREARELLARLLELTAKEDEGRREHLQALQSIQAALDRIGTRQDQLDAKMEVVIGLMGAGIRPDRDPEGGPK